MTDLFDLPPTARNSDPETSHEAESAIALRIGALHERILCALKAKGAMTASEVMEATGLLYNTAWRRLSELKTLNRVHNTEFRRKNPRGRNEVVVALGPSPT